MINGMTGFGSAEITRGKIKAIVEIKSLNHRYFDLSFYLPVGFAAAENKIKQIIQKRIERGRVSVSLKITSKPRAKVLLNYDLAKAQIVYAKKLKQEFGLKGELTISDVLRMPGVLETREDPVTADEMTAVLSRCVDKSLNSLVAMRKTEGRSLAVDVKDKLKKMNVQIRDIQSRSRMILQASRKNLSEEEFSSFQRNNDINEEVSRLKHFVDEVTKLLNSDSSAGKKIDFVAQEMQRETNTIGSKLQDKAVANAVISLKSKIEKIREQAQNIE